MVSVLGLDCGTGHVVVRTKDATAPVPVATREATTAQTCSGSCGNQMESAGAQGTAGSAGEGREASDGFDEAKAGTADRRYEDLLEAVGRHEGAEEFRQRLATSCYLYHRFQRF